MTTKWISKGDLKKLGLKSISLFDMKLDKIIISKSSEHVGEDFLKDILPKKLENLENEHQCCWAHKGLNVEHTQRFCNEWKQETGDDIYVFFPYTPSNSTKHSQVTKYNENTTGTEGSVAFVIKEFLYIKETLEFKKLYKHYWAVNKNEEKEACNTLKSSVTSKCLKLKKNVDIHQKIEEIQYSEEGEETIGILVAKLQYPYHIKL
ncbi:hypothetical protein [Amedibacillus sp. YH-ame10]